MADIVIYVKKLIIRGQEVGKMIAFLITIDLDLDLFIVK